MGKDNNPTNNRPDNHYAADQPDRALLYEKYSPKEIARIGGLWTRIFRPNRLHVLEYLGKGATEYTIEQDLAPTNASEDEQEACKRTVQRHLTFFSAEGIAEYNQETSEWKLTDFGESIYNICCRAARLSGPIEELSLDHNIVGKKQVTHSKVKKRFRNNVREFEEDVEEYKGRDIARPEYNGRIKEMGRELTTIKEIATDVIQPGDRYDGFSVFEDPISNHGLEPTFLQGQPLVDKIENNNGWWNDAADHQEQGADYYTVDRYFPFTAVTIFEDRHVGVFIEGDGTSEIKDTYLELESQASINWANRLFMRNKKTATPKQYLPRD